MVDLLTSPKMLEFAFNLKAISRFEESCAADVNTLRLSPEDPEMCNHPSPWSPGKSTYSNAVRIVEAQSPNPASLNLLN